MAGRLRAIVFFLALACCNFSAQHCRAYDQPPQEPAQQQPPPPRDGRPPQPPPPGGDWEKHHHPFLDKLKNAGSVEEAKRLIDELPPELREKFRLNFQRWKNMTPEERKALRDREEERRQRRIQEAEKSIQQSGLQLDKEAREKYIQRYMQERQSIEMQLQKEMEEKRRPLIEDMVKRLQSEFKSGDPPPTSSGTSASPAE